MLHGVVSQFLLKVDWGTLDYLIVDMPPGTGDVQLSLTQVAPVSGAVVVTTPQEVSLQDVRKAIMMFEKVGVPLLGIVENMSFFVADSWHKRHEIFGTGAAVRSRRNIAFRCSPSFRSPRLPARQARMGKPVVVSAPDSLHAKAFDALARSVAHELAEASLRWSCTGNQGPGRQRRKILAGGHGAQAARVVNDLAADDREIDGGLAGLCSALNGSSPSTTRSAYLLLAKRAFDVVFSGRVGRDPKV